MRLAGGALLGFGATAEEATPEELSGDREHAAAYSTAQLQLDELVQSEVYAARTGERVLERLEQQADELWPLHHGSSETQDDAGAGSQQGEAMIGLRNFFSHGGSIVALLISVHRIAAQVKSAAPALARSLSRSHTQRQ